MANDMREHQMERTVRPVGRLMCSLRDLTNVLYCGRLDGVKCCRKLQVSQQASCDALISIRSIPPHFRMPLRRAYDGRNVQAGAPSREFAQV